MPISVILAKLIKVVKRVKIAIYIIEILMIKKLFINKLRLKSLYILIITYPISVEKSYLYTTTILYLLASVTN